MNSPTSRRMTLLAVLAIVLPAESDMGGVEIEQTAVGDRDAMRIAREIGQDLLRTGEGAGMGVLADVPLYGTAYTSFRSRRMTCTGKSLALGH